MEQDNKDNHLEVETSQTTSTSNSNVNRGEDEDSGVKYKFWNESKKIWVVAGPAIITRFSSFGLTVISQAFIGHIGSTELAAFSLVFTVFIRFANGIMMGMASALQTLCGQSYGAKIYHMLGVYLQRSWIIMTTTALLLVPVCFFISPIFKALGQDKTVSEVAGHIGIWTIPGVFALVVSFTCQMFLQSQSRNVVIGYLATFALIIHILLSWLLTVKFKFGIPGVMVALITSYWIPNVGQLLFVLCGGCPETWKGFSTLAFKDLWGMIKLSLSSGVMLCLELWYNAVLILLTGNMENAEVAIGALGICLNLYGWELMISMGFLAASGVRVSNELGRGSPKGAKYSVVVLLITSITIGFLFFLLFLSLRGKFAYIFTDNEEVAKGVADLSPLLAFSILMNSIQPVLSGVAIGTGRQKVVACINITCYYVVGVPVGVVLGYVLDLQVKGVWMGMLFGTLVQTLVLIIVTYRTDWDKQMSNARNRVDKWTRTDPQESNPNSS
ncbi:protein DETOXIFICATION 21-like [Argentina anserina]|uniref:protein DETOXIFICATION 21-like n=1 Tax=Argentina anserina TaxID=57926 RepID=UPI0021762E90|nr:protein DETOXIFICATION 21-like [Potentilla anserina]